MRDPNTDRLLAAVRTAVTEARTGGVTVRACIWDATTAAVDGEGHFWPTPEARRTADAACRAVEPVAVAANPAPPRHLPWTARVLFAAANHLARRATPEAPRA